jgi:hypothetical protein
VREVSLADAWRRGWWVHDGLQRMQQLAPPFVFHVFAARNELLLARFRGWMSCGERIGFVRCAWVRHKRKHMMVSMRGCSALVRSGKSRRPDA